MRDALRQWAVYRKQGYGGRETRQGMNRSHALLTLLVAMMMIPLSGCVSDGVNGVDGTQGAQGEKGEITKRMSDCCSELPNPSITGGTPKHAPDCSQVRVSTCHSQKTLLLYVKVTVS